MRFTRGPFLISPLLHLYLLPAAAFALARLVAVSPSASPAWVTAAPCAGLNVHFFVA